MPLPKLECLPAWPFLTRWRELRRQGWPTLLYHACCRILDRGHLRCVLDARLLQVITIEPWHLRLPPRLPRGLTIRELLPGDTAAIERLRPAKGWAYGTRFQSGHRAYGAFLDGRLVAFLWCLSGPALLPSSLQFFWRLGSNLAWLYDLYSDPEVLGAIAPLYAYLRHDPPQPGCWQLAGQNAFDNLRSRLAHRRLGYRVCAMVWSVRLGPFRLHAARAVAAGRGTGEAWRWFRKPAILPVDRWAAAAGPAAPIGASASLGAPLDSLLDSPPHASLDAPVHASPDPSWRGFEPGGRAPDAGPQPVRAQQSASSERDGETRTGFRVRLRCCCGHEIEASGVAGERYLCPCGRELGRENGGLIEIDSPTPYWGEIPQDRMTALLRRAAARGWRAAVEDLTPPALHDYITSPERAGFADVTPLPAGARVLDVGAGWGGIAAALAQSCDVVAFEGVRERARFIALRAEQDGLTRLRIVNGDLRHLALARRQFDLIVVNGVLEWVGLFHTSVSPAAAQLLFLDQLRQLLTPGGYLHVGIENRFALSSFRGRLDHSGLPYTSLLPRPLARWVCGRSRSYRSSFNTGYRTYTYSYRGYERLFAQAGLVVRQSWVSPEGYNSPARLLPPDTAALRHAAEARRPAPGWRGRLRSRIREAAARDWIWRWLGSDFVFLLAAGSPVRTAAPALAPSGADAPRFSPEQVARA